MDDFLGLQNYRIKTYTASRVRNLARRGLTLLRGKTEVDGLGADISVYQPEIDWEIAKNKFEFLFIRALYGLSVDSKFETHWKGSKQVGKKRGAYLYYKNNLDPIAQAQKLYDTCLAAGDLGELPPVIDVEGYDNLVLTASRIKLCCEKIGELFGVKPIIYTGFYIWRDSVSGDKSWAATYLLWIAYYPFTNYKPEYHEQVLNYTPLIPAPWTKFDLWQWTAYAPGNDFGVQSNYLDLDYASPEFATQYLKQKQIDVLIDPTITATHVLTKNSLLYNGANTNNWINSLYEGAFVRVFLAQLVNDRYRVVSIHPNSGTIWGWIPQTNLKELDEPVLLRAFYPDFLD